jgi:opacity protein-like surface antigen
MKKASILFGAAGALLCVTGAANADVYGKLQTGGTFGGEYTLPGPDQELDGGWDWGGAIGGNVTPNVRLEGEYSQNRSDFKSIPGDSKANFALANAYYDFAPDAQVTPFVGAGIGAGKIDTGAADDTAFAYKLTGGVAAKFSDRVTGELAYNHKAVPELSLGGVDAKYREHAVTAGVRVKFGQ